MASKTADLLPLRRYSSVAELRWNETTTVRTPRGDVHVRSIEVKHWGARLRNDTYRGWSGFILTGKEQPENLAGSQLSANIFSLLGIKPILGAAVAYS